MAARRVSVEEQPTPEALADRLGRTMAKGLLELARAVAERAGKSEYFDQTNSPLGREKHKRLAAKGVIPSTKIGRRILVKREDMEVYLRREGITRGEGAEDDVDAIVDEIVGASGGKKR
jgi:excisionase family DNA binding protein